MFVGGVVVQNQVQVTVGWSSRIDQLQELQPFLVSVTALALANESPVGCVECGKESGGTMAHVIMGHGSRAAFLERKTRLRTVESLDLTLLIATEDQGMLGGIEIEPNDVFELLDKERIVGDLEGTCQVRLEPVLAPDLTDRGRANVQRLGQGPSTPLRGHGRARSQRTINNQFADVRPIHWRAPTSRCIVFNPGTPRLLKTLSPPADLLSSHSSNQASDLLVLVILRGQENDLTTFPKPFGRQCTPDLLAQPLLVLFCDRDNRSNAH